MVLYELSPEEDTGNVAIIAHGRNGYGLAPHMQLISNAYLEQGYRVLAPDLCNSGWHENQSDGTGADFTISAHTRDVRRVIQWVDDPASRIALAGHSMGGHAVCALAANAAFAHRIDHVLSVSPMVDWQRFIAETCATPDSLAQFKAEAPAAFEEAEALNHSLYEHIPHLTCPVSLIVGEKDGRTSPASIRDFYDALQAAHPHAPHSYIDVPGQGHLIYGAQPLYAAAIRRMEQEAAEPDHHPFLMPNM